MSDKPYRDPETLNIEDWKWHPMEHIERQLSARRELPEHVLPYAEYMQHMADRAQHGGISPRDLIKAHTITQSSIGRGGLSHATATKRGMHLPNTGGEVRPEGAFSEWLGSPMGQHFLDAAERGDVHPEAMEDIRTKFAPFGKQNAQVDAMRYAAENMPGMAEHANRALTGSKEEYRDFAKGIKGIAGAKSGFIGSLLGRGDQPTLDARQLNLHSMSHPTKVPESMMSRGRGAGGQEAVDRLSARHEALGYDIPHELLPHAQHLIHHDIWDQLGGTQTTHEDLIRAMRGYAEGGEVNHPHIDQMLQELDHYAKGGQPERASEALGRHEGKTLMVTQADRTKVGGGYLGGPGFSGMQHTDPAYEDKAWGVMTPGMASTIIGANRRVPEGDALWSTMIGTPEQHSSNQMVYDKLVRDFKNHAKAGLLSPELHSRINARLSAMTDKEGTPFFGEGSDIMGRGFTGNADTFAKRRMIADLIAGHGVDGKKGQIGKYDEIMRKSMDPALNGIETHAIGNRLFNLSGETSHRPDLHPAFPQMLHGEDYGQEYHPVPKEIMLRDYMNKFQEEKGRNPGYMDLTRGYGPSQHLSEDFLSHLQKQGYADGGEVGPSYDDMLAHVMLHKADGGSIRRPTEMGVDEAPNSDIKWYMPPGAGEGNMPVGGVDFNPGEGGQQFAPEQQPQEQPPQGAPGQPQGMQPPAGPQALAGPPSNILSMTPQGQAMAAMKAPQAAAVAPPVVGKPNPSPLIKNGMARMAKGGSAKPVVRGIIKEQVTVTPNLDEMRYALLAAKKAKR